MARERLDIVAALLGASMAGGGGGGGGIDHYSQLPDKPKINGNVLSGDKSSEQLGLQSQLSWDEAPTENSQKPVKSGGIYAALADKVDKVQGKDLSTNDYTSADKTKLDGIEAGAEVNIIKSITLNGTKLTPDANKNVVITVITNTVDNLVNYYLKSETYNKTEVDNIVNAIKNSRFEVVPTLPTTDIKTNVIYLVPKSTAQTDNVKDEYINLDGTISGWEKIGDTEIDLSGYVTTTALNTALADYTTTADLTNLLAGKVDKVIGKGLSTNDYTNTDKELVDTIPNLAPISLVKDTVGWTGKNLLKNLVTSQIVNSVTYTVNSDKSVTVNGTGTNPNAGVRELNQHFTLPAGDYILSGSPHNVLSETGFRLQIYNWTDGIEVVKCETDEDAPFTIGENKDIAVRIWFRGTPSTGGNDITFYPMIRRANVIDDTYEPYHEPVEAMFEEEIHGVNLNKGDASHTYIRGEGATAPYRTYNCPLAIPFAAGDKFIVSFDVTNSANFDVSTSGLAMRFWGNNGVSASEDWIVGNTNGHYEHTFLITQAGSYKHDLYLYLQQPETNPDATLTVKNLMVRKATIEDSAYHPYNNKAIQNQINDKGILGARNLWVPKKVNGSGNGLTWTYDEDGKVTVTGQNTGQSSYYINILDRFTLPKGTYIFSGCPVADSIDISLFIRPYNTTSATWGQDYGDSPKVMELTEDTDVMGFIRIGGGVDVGTQIFKPMITLASDTQSNYDNFTPYTMTNRELTKKVPDTDLVEVSSLLDSTYVSTCGSFRYKVRNGICFVYINNIKFTSAAIDVVDAIILPEGVLPRGYIPASSMLWNKSVQPILLGLMRNNSGDIKVTVNGVNSDNVNSSWYAASFSYPVS